MPGAKKRRHYKVELLACREAIDRALAAGAPYASIGMMVREKGESVSQTAVWRYHNSLDRAAERIQKAKDQVKVLIEAVKEQPNTELAEAANQLLLQAAIERIAEAEEGFQDVDLVKVGRLVSNLERSGVLRERLKLTFHRQIKTAVENIEEKTKGKGLSPEAMKTIKEELYGITEAV